MLLNSKRLACESAINMLRIGYKGCQISDSGQFGLSLHAPFSHLARSDFLDSA